MRCRVELVPMCDVCHLDLNYNYHLMSAILDVIGFHDRSVSEMIHSEQLFKPMTFSRLFVRGYEVRGSRLFIASNSNLYFVLSSHLDDVVTSFMEGAKKRERMRISHIEFFIKRVTLLEVPRFYEKSKFIMLSPLVISKPVDVSGKVYHEYLGPTHEEFKERFSENLMRKYEYFTGKDPSPVEIIPSEEYIKKRNTSKLITVKGVKVRGHVFPFVLIGDPEVMRIGYESGFGERTAQGFGCAEIREGGKVDTI